MIKNLRHACIVVRDLEKSLRFYTEIIGLEISKILTLKGRYPETVLDVKGIELTYVKMRTPCQSRVSPPVFELHYWHKPRISPKTGRSHFSFTVENIDREYKRLTKQGVRFISPPTRAPDNTTKICFAYDPDNNLIEFVQDLNK
ncbi:MAG: VOC family protein [Candidatus Omnitrophota bacterium]|jgi:lactoylglutathione lyase